MDIELNTLLVALMFVTILCMGIGNILMVLADVINRATSARRAGLHNGWIVLLFLVHLNLFWHTKEILNVESWDFAGFLLVIAGPILVFFATSVLLTSPSEQEQADLKGFFLHVGRLFFIFFACVQGWVLVVDAVLLGQLSSADIFNAALGALALCLAFNRSLPIHVAGLWLAWAIGLGSIVLRGMKLVT